jgi:hypothetical protein
VSGRIVKAAVARVDLGGEDWADVRLRLTYGDRAEILERLLDIRVPADGSLDLTTEREIHHREANIELLVLSVAAWGGPGFCELEQHPHQGACRIYPITRENIAALDESAERILKYLTEHSVRRTPDFTRPPSQGGSTAGAGARAPSRAAARSSSRSAAGTAGRSGSSRRRTRTS